MSGNNVVPLLRPRRKNTRDIVAEAIDAGCPMPLSVMLENLDYWHGEALTLGSSNDPSDRALGRIARSQAQRCAVEAAPFVHPRLQNTVLSGDEDGGPIKGRVYDINRLTDEQVTKLLEAVDAGGSVTELLDAIEPDAGAP